MGATYLIFSTLSAQTGIPTPGLPPCDSQVQDLLSDFDVPGATLAIAKDGKLVYMKAYGFTDTSETIPAQPHNLFRVGSISKSITAIAIMKLVENGQLALDDTVFGPSGILGTHPFISQSNITDNRIYNITIRHLMQHTAGWDPTLTCTPSPTAPYPIQIPGCEVFIFPLHVSQTLGLSNPTTTEMNIRWLLEKGLDYAPGTSGEYFNMGFAMLGVVIESVTGQNYEDYVQTQVLSPLGICDMKLGRSLITDRAEREVEYKNHHTNYPGLGSQYLYPSGFGTGALVPIQYGGFLMESIGGTGAWIATARDLVRVLLAVDGFSTKPDILTQASIDTMTTPSALSSIYAKGWQIAPNGYGHSGGLFGASSHYFRRDDGYSWAVIINRYAGDNNAFWDAFFDLPVDCIANQPATLPTYDLLASPSQGAGGVGFPVVKDSSVQVQWTKGDGDSRLLVIREGAPVEDFPLDGVVYSADAEFAQGDDLGNGTFVAYNDTGSTASITGLVPSTTYFVRVFEYNQNPQTGNLTLYRLCDSESEMITTCPTLQTNLQVQICAGDTFLLGNQILTTSGVFTETFPGLGGCDSTVTLDLTVVPQINISLNESICIGDSYPFDGQNLTSPGSYSATFTASGGCDSVVTLNLSVLSTFRDTLNEVICEGDFYPFGGSLLNQAGTYQDSLISTAGCDSIVVLNLAVDQEDLITQDSLYCWPTTIVFQGQTLQVPGTYTLFSGSNVNGCDSTEIWSFGVIGIEADPIITSTDTLFADPGGDSYVWLDCQNGQTPIPGANGQFFIPPGSGSYSVAVTKGLCTDTTGCVEWVLSDLSNSIPQLMVEVYPNPASGRATLKMSGAWIGDYYLKMFDQKGRVVFQYSGSKQKADQEQPLNLSRLPSGIYQLLFVHDRGRLTRSIQIGR